MLKTLLAGGRFDREAGTIKKIEPPLNFADVLYPVVKEHILQWAIGPSSFTVLGLLEAPDFSSKKELSKSLRAHKKALEKAAKGEALVEEKKKDGASSKKKSKSSAADPKPAQPKPTGNQGTKLLLEKLSE